MDPILQVPELGEEELLDMQPIEFGFPEVSNGGGSMPGYDLTDALRVSLGNREGPVPKSQLQGLSPSQLRELKNKRLEDSLGWAKPLGQFYNVITSPAVVEGMITGVPNALSKLGGFIVDPEGAAGDMPQIPQEPIKALNPLRDGDLRDTPSDKAGYELGAEAAGEVAGVATGSTLIRRVPQFATLANRLRQTQRVKSLAVAAQTNQGVRRGLNTLRFGSEAIVDTSLAALFQDADFGNSSDALALLGIDETPLSTRPENSYGQNLFNKVVADGVLLPLTLIGAGQLTPWTRRLADGDLAWNLDELAAVELEPYVPRSYTQPQLPPGAPNQDFDSAIDRSTSTQKQIEQVQDQRARVDAMFPGYNDFRVGEDGQGYFRMDDPTVDAGAQTIDGQVSGPDSEVRLPPKQQSLNLDFSDTPDPRPEITTYLAELDELSDAQLKEVLRNVDTTEKVNARELDLQNAQTRVDELTAELADIEARMALPEGEKGRLSEMGGKRKLNKAQADLEQQKNLVTNLQAEPLDAASVGDQLEIQLNMQRELELNPPADAQLPPITKFEWNEELEMWQPKGRVGGYPSVDAYRQDISGWPRDLLRKLAAPTNSPEVAALVKARTGRRPASAKKSDIVDALVELAERRGSFAEVADQLDIPDMQTNINLGVEPEYAPRGLSNTVREQMKAKILEMAIRNQEVQPDITVLPTQLPKPEFNQGQLIDNLFNTEDNGQLVAFANGELPTYKASGKNAEALIEEVRARFGWLEMDGKAQVAAQQAMAEKNGWNKLTWEEKKQARLLGSGFYAQAGGETTVIKRSAPAQQWTPEGNIPAKDAPVTPPKTKKARAKQKAAQVQGTRNNVANLQAQLDAKRKQLEGAQCNG